MNAIWNACIDSAHTAAGFFWKAAWAFVLGYAISAMIQAFVPKRRLTRLLGDPGPTSIALATGFGAVSSSCSFAALATARSLVQKGAHFVAAVAFMFASTNLVIELGILIFLFLGWEFLVAEIVGGVLLIAISSALIRATYPKRLLDEARARLDERSEEQEDFDWRARIRSREGWELVGHHFVAEWAMVWREIVVGFTVAGVVAALVPPAFWETIFPLEGESAGFLDVLWSAALAPFVAAATFIGSMGNIPLATVLHAEGVLFAGIMGFIYSDLMVPPLVKVNARYYGWKVALYIAAVMYASIVITAIALHYGFALLDRTPSSGRRIEEVTRFAFDYTFFLNLAAIGMVAAMTLLSARRTRREGGGEHDHGGPGFQTILALACLLAVALGLVGGWLAE